jgi:hypothetical protein
MATIEQRTTQEGKAVYRVKVRVKVPHHAQTRFTIYLMLSGSARSQGSNPWQTQVMALGVSRSLRIFLWIWSAISD